MSALLLGQLKTIQGMFCRPSEFHTTPDLPCLLSFISSPTLLPTFVPTYPYYLFLLLVTTSVPSCPFYLSLRLSLLVPTTCPYYCPYLSLLIVTTSVPYYFVPSSLFALPSRKPRSLPSPLFRVPPLLACLPSLPVCLPCPVFPLFSFPAHYPPFTSCPSSCFSTHSSQPFSPSLSPCTCSFTQICWTPSSRRNKKHPATFPPVRSLSPGA